MALNAKNIKPANNNNFPPQKDFEPGTYPARLVQIIEMGLQPQRPHAGEAKPPQNEIMLTYEFVDFFMQDEEGNDIEDKPRWLSETLPFYGLFADRAKSTQRYKAFDPEEVYEGDFARCAETPVNVTVVLNKKADKVYTNIAGVTAMRPRDAAKCPELVNPVKVFDLDNPDLEVFNKLPEWIREKIKGNLNYEGSVLQAALLPAKAQQNAPAEEKVREAKPKAERVAKEDRKVQKDEVFTEDEQDDKPW